MKWEELEEKHKAQWDGFYASREKSYKEMTERHEELEYAFRDVGEAVPLQLKERMREEYDDWRKRWDHEGESMQKITDSQKKERQDFVKIEKFKGYLQDLDDKREREKFTEHEL